MRCNTELKILLQALENSLLFSFVQLLTALYVSDCQGFLKYTEVLITALIFSVAW